MTYEESQKLKLRQEDERKRQEERRKEEERKRAEEKRKEEELLAMLEEEKLMCDVDLEETACASDIEVSPVIKKTSKTLDERIVSDQKDKRFSKDRSRFKQL